MLKTIICLHDSRSFCFIPYYLKRFSLEVVKAMPIISSHSKIVQGKKFISFIIMIAEKYSIRVLMSGETNRLFSKVAKRWL